MTVLAVFAHPDDESLACGGTLARLADAGARVVLLCASRGERGSSAGPARDDALGHDRATEVRLAAEALGVAELLLFDHPDGNLRWAHVTELHAQIVMSLRRFKPNAVITFGSDGLYWHPDHIGVHERTTTAVQALGAEAPPLYYVTMPRGVMPGVVAGAAVRGWMRPAKGFWSIVPDAFGIEAEAPTVIVDVAEWVPRKLAALRCHRSQIGGGDPLSQISDEEARRLFGAEHFHHAPGNRAPILEAMAAAT